MATNNNTKGSFTDDEREAMKARAKELRDEARSNKTREEGENDVKTAIAALTEPDRSMADRVHQLVKQAAPELFPKTWYGMPAYANKEGKVVCFFQAAQKFNARYATFGFSDMANLDDGNMWASAFALKKLTATDEAKIIQLLKRAIG